MASHKPLDILVFGTGAVGSVLGWRMSQAAQAKVTVVCRSNYDAVRSNGLHLRTKMWGNGHFTPFRVVQSPREIAYRSFDYIVCANKVTGSPRTSMVDDLRPVVSPHTTLVSAQNGVHVENPLRSAFPHNTILSAICYISCQQLIPGHVDQLSGVRPHALHVGLFDTSENRDIETDDSRLETFVGLDSKFRRIDDAPTERWTKQVFNGAWNPMTAISGLETHALLRSRHVEIVKQLAVETHALANAIGVPLPADLPIQTLTAARNNPTMAPSMLQDVRARRPMEVESLCGNICRLADRVGVPVPTVRAVYETLLEMNRDILRPDSSIANLADNVLHDALAASTAHGSAILGQALAAA